MYQTNKCIENLIHYTSLYISLFFSIILFKSYVNFPAVSFNLEKLKMFLELKNISTAIEAVVQVATY